MATLVQSIPHELCNLNHDVSEFAAEVRKGLSSTGRKMISPRFLYDDLGSSLFEAITLLPEYGLTRADQRLLAAYAPEIAAACGPLSAIAELGSGSGKKTISILRAALELNEGLSYHPIDISSGALTACAREIGSLCQVRAICADWTHGLAEIASGRTDKLPLLLLFLGSSIGNLERTAIPDFLYGIRSQLRSGDLLLLGADLEKDVESMLLAYDDPTGVTAAFNLNLLGRMNRELGAEFDLRAFQHEARWNNARGRIEMHLVSKRDQSVRIAVLEESYFFAARETIWTESSHKFSPDELTELGLGAGFLPVRAWTDCEWPLSEVLWKVP